MKLFTQSCEKKLRKVLGIRNKRLSLKEFCDIAPERESYCLLLRRCGCDSNRPKFGGANNGRLATVGTIRGDYCMSFQENIVHTSDLLEAAVAELNRFFKPEEIFDCMQTASQYLYANDEY